MPLFEQGFVVQYDGLGHEQISLSSTPQSLAAPTAGWGRTRRVVLRNLGQPIDWTCDGTDPDGETSFKSLADEIVVLDIDFQVFRMVASPDSTGPADVRIAYFGI